MNTAAFLTPRLLRLARKLREALARVEQVGDDEAIHDLRVALRRLRSLLKPARTIYGAFHTEAVRAALKAVADASGDLRDEEVLLQTLASLDLPAPLRPDLDGWLTLRKQRELQLRASFLALLSSGQAHHASALLDALLLLPVDPARDEPLFAFTIRTVERADQRAQEWVIKDTGDQEALHQLRILYKRLRYAAEGFSDALPPVLAARAQVAEGFQKVLGEIHDLDVARATVEAETELSVAVRPALLEALRLRRGAAVQSYLALRAAQNPTS